MTAPTPDAWAPSFRDTAGREWRVILTDELVAAIGAEKLDGLFVELVAGRIRGNGRAVVEAAYTCCESQADAAWVLPEVFGRALADPEAIVGAAMALMAAIAVRKGIGTEAARELFESHTKG
jgi:hypothetical protein